MSPASSRLRIPSDRIVRWVDGFHRRHGDGRHVVADGAMLGTAADGSWFVLRLPFDAMYHGAADPRSLAAAANAPPSWGVLLVRKGGFAVARLHGADLAEHTIGRRHVQGRTKAGGQSQQRFARRRDNQARAAYRAAADHAVAILRGGPLVVGGDRGAVEAVLSDGRLPPLTVVEPWIDTPEPRRRELDAAIRDAQAVAVEVSNARPRADR